MLLSDAILVADGKGTARKACAVSKGFCGGTLSGSALDRSPAHPVAPATLPTCAAAPTIGVHLPITALWPGSTRDGQERHGPTPGEARCLCLRLRAAGCSQTANGRVLGQQATHGHEAWSRRWHARATSRPHDLSPLPAGSTTLTMTPSGGQSTVVTLLLRPHEYPVTSTRRAQEDDR